MPESDAPEADAAADIAVAAIPANSLAVPLDSEAIRQIAYLVHSINSFGRESTQLRGRTYKHSFQVSDEDIRRIDQRVRSLMHELPLHDSVGIAFRSEARFTNLSTQGFDNLEDLLTHAGEKKDPESLLLRWSSVVSNPFGEAVSVELLFVTEKPLDTQLMGMFEINQSAIELSIGGPNTAWADEAFSSLDAHVQATKIGGIYTPLMIFKNKDIVNYLSWSLAVVGQIVAWSKIGNLVSTASNMERVDRILAPATLDDRFAEFVRDSLVNPSSTGQFVLVVGGGAVAFIVSIALGYMVLPKLAPKSGIEIGLAVKRFARYRNAFNFLVFGVLITGVMVPLLLALFT